MAASLQIELMTHSSSWQNKHEEFLIAVLLYVNVMVYWTIVDYLVVMICSLAIVS